MKRAVSAVIAAAFAAASLAAVAADKSAAPERCNVHCPSL